jgi:hypothetical protein
MKNTAANRSRHMLSGSPTTDHLLTLPPADVGLSVGAYDGLLVVAPRPALRLDPFLEQSTATGRRREQAD